MRPILTAAALLALFAAPWGCKSDGEKASEPRIVAAPSPAKSAVPEIHLSIVSGHGLPGVYMGGIAAADFDKDGRLDIVLAGYFKRGHDERANCISSVELAVYRNVTVKGGPIRFEQLARYPDLGVCGAEVVTGDFNGDGNPDFAVAVKNGVDTTVYFGRGDGHFDPKVVEKNFGTHSTSFGMAAADMDKDGKDDLIFNSAADPTYYHAGTGLWYSWSKDKFVPMQIDFPKAMSYGGTIAAGDLDGDGYPEIAVAGNASSAFGSHYCKNVMYGEIHKNQQGQLSQKPLVIIPNFALRKFGRASMSTPPDPRRFEETCDGGDNVQYAIADVDRDGHNDVIVSGSAGFWGRPDLSGKTHYSFSILRNVTGTGTDFVTWENVGIGKDGKPGDLNGEATNSGVGNVDERGIAIGDLNGDGWPEIVVEGHRKHLESNDGRYIFDDMLFLNETNGEWRWLPDAIPIPRPVAVSNPLMADLDGDGRVELILTGAEEPYHSNGRNPEDKNTPETIKTWILKSKP